MRHKRQYLEKVKYIAIILVPFMGIVLNLKKATCVFNHGMSYDLAHATVNVDVFALIR